MRGSVLYYSVLLFVYEYIFDVASVLLAILLHGTR